ncbi:MAG: DUF3810 family protein [Clostridiales bacterium]|nr:DUF3810 family protein [Clostridiales bacterium]
MKRFPKEKHVLRSILLILIPALLLAVFFFVPRILPLFVSELYCRDIFPVISLPGNIFSSMFHMSLTENFVVVGAVVLVSLLMVWIIMLIMKILGKGGLISFLLKSISAVLIISCCGMLVFQLMHGMNYRRISARTHLELDNDDHSIEAYQEALSWAYQNMLQARYELGEDYMGVAHLTTSFEDASTHANLLLDEVSARYGFGLSRNFVRAKPVAMSDYWSLTNIVGMYDPFLGEANINTGYLDIKSFAHTLCHELCHAKGYGSETDCNIISTVACISSNRPDFRYAGYYFIFWDLFDVIYKNAYFNDGEIPTYVYGDLMAPVFRDMKAADDYWKLIEGMELSEEIATVSEKTNDTFLKVNGESGVGSYKVPEDVYLDYYMTYVKAETDA